MKNYVQFHNISLYWHSSATVTEGVPYFLLSCKANSRVNPTKTGHGPVSFKIFVLLDILFVCVVLSIAFVCKCVLYYCQRVAAQLQLTNI